MMTGAVNACYLHIDQQLREINALGGGPFSVVVPGAQPRSELVLEVSSYGLAIGHAVEGWFVMARFHLGEHACFLLQRGQRQLGHWHGGAR